MGAQGLPKLNSEREIVAGQAGKGEVLQQRE